MKRWLSGRPEGATSQRRRCLLNGALESRVRRSVAFGGDVKWHWDLTLPTKDRGWRRAGGACVAGTPSRLDVGRRQEGRVGLGDDSADSLGSSPRRLLCATSEFSLACRAPDYGYDEGTPGEAKGDSRRRFNAGVSKESALHSAFPQRHVGSLL